MQWTLTEAGCNTHQLNVTTVTKKGTWPEIANQRSIRVMTQKEIQDAHKYFNEQEAAVKDAAEIKKKEDFPAITQ